MKRILSLPIFLLLFLDPLCSQKDAQRNTALKFDFTKLAIQKLKELVRAHGAPPEDIGGPDSVKPLIDDLDTEARSFGEMQTVQLLKFVDAQMSANNVFRTNVYYKIVLAGSSKEAAIAQTMQDSGIAPIVKKEELCTTSVDKMLRSVVFAKQPQCGHILTDLSPPKPATP